MDLKIRYSRLADGTKKASIPEDTRGWALSFIQEHAGKPPSAIEAVVQEGQEELLGACPRLRNRGSLRSTPKSRRGPLALVRGKVDGLRLLLGQDCAYDLAKLPLLGQGVCLICVHPCLK